MKTRTKVIIDWILLIVFCTFLFLTIELLPKYWGVLEYLLKGNVEYIPAVFIGSILSFLLFYTTFIKKQRELSSYVWFIILTFLLFFVYDYIKDPYDKMHLFEYFILSFLFFKALHHHIFSYRLYFLGAIFSMLIAVIDETTQLFTADRTFSLVDIGADFTAAVLGQLSIALIIRPKLERWRFKLKLKRGQLRAEKRWLSRRRHI